MNTDDRALASFSDADLIQTVQRVLARRQVGTFEAEDAAILEAFVERFGRHVRSLAKDVAFGDLEWADDLQNEIWERVFKGLHRWEDRGCLFTTWLATVAASVRSNHFNKHGSNEYPRAMKIPANATRRIKDLKEARSRLIPDFQQGPTNEEIAKALGWTVEEVNEIDRTILFLHAESLDEAEPSDTGQWSTKVDEIPDRPTFLDVADKIHVRDCLRQMRREYAVAIKLWAEGESYAKIASELGVTVDNINNFIGRAKKELHKCLKETDEI